MIFNPTDKVLEIGGGDRPVYRPNLDIRKLPTVDIVADLNERFPVEDASFDGVYSAYLIEHISWRKVRHFISEMHRVLKPGGKTFIVTANLLEQCRLLVNTPVWSDNEVCCIFGDQNYSGSDWRANSHTCGFSPEFAVKLFKEAGFEQVQIDEHPNCKTDMLIIAIKANQDDVSNWTEEQREKAFDKEYFNGGGHVGGYANEGYWDYPVHWITFNHVLAKKPESVLEVGCARGYLVKRFEDIGIKSKGLEISQHCYLTRATDGVIKWDITKTPWPIADKEFDLCISVAVLEHIPEKYLPAIMSEMRRVSKRGLHGVDLGDHDDGFDKTHCTLKSLDWWKSMLPTEQEAVDKEELERNAGGPPGSDGKFKLNFGSFKTMYHSGWINVDAAPLADWAKRYGYQFIQMDARSIKDKNISSETVDCIHASHFLEHLTYEEGKEFIEQCYRIMKKGAVMRIAVPCTKKLISKYLDGSIKAFDQINDTSSGYPTNLHKLWALLLGSDHKAIYDADSLVGLLKSVGFDAKQMEFRKSISKEIRTETIDMFPDLSLYVDAIKT